MIFITCFFFALLNLASLEEVSDGTVHSIAREKKLVSELKHKYSINQKIFEKRNTTVIIELILKSFNFYNFDEEFTMSSLMYISWSDPSLEWKPADYDGINSVNLIKPRLLWTPEIKVDNQLEAYEMQLFHFFSYKCQIRFTGIISCIAPVDHTVVCQIKLYNWPYDVQTCHFKYSAKENVQLTNNRTKIITKLGSKYGTGWKILANYFKVSSESRNKATLTLVIEREAVGLAALNVIPLVVIVILNIAAMIIDVKSNTRVYITTFCLLSNFMFMQTINDNIPAKGFDTPAVLIFLRTSIVLSAFSIVMTFILKNLRRTKHSTPANILKFNEFFRKESIKVFIWPKWEAEVVEHEDMQKRLDEWMIFANVLNSLNITFYCILYSILFIVYMPRPIPTPK